MKEKRTCAMATLLPDAKVPVAGGDAYVTGPAYPAGVSPRACTR